MVLAQTCHADSLWQAEGFASWLSLGKQSRQAVAAALSGSRAAEDQATQLSPSYDFHQPSRMQCL